MRFYNCVTLSIVVLGILCEARGEIHWNGKNINSKNNIDTFIQSVSSFDAGIAKHPTAIDHPLQNQNNSLLEKNFVSMATAPTNMADFLSPQSRVSNLQSRMDIVFSGNTQVSSQQFNVFLGTANITFKNSAQMQGGNIINNGGTANIEFQNDSKMTSPNGNTATINTADGITNLTASSNAMLTGVMVQSGGAFNGTFLNSSNFNGNAMQTDGTSDIKFKDDSSWNGSFEQTGGGSTSTITFDNRATMTGDIITKNGTTDIKFNANTKITGDIKAQGKKNDVTFTSATLDGNLTLDGLQSINGNSEAKLTSSQVTKNIQGYDKVDMVINDTKVNGHIYQGGSYDSQAMNVEIKNNSTIDGGFKGYGGSNNELTIKDSTINSGVKQDTGTLKVDATTATITGGFSGTNNSNNTVNMIGGTLSGGANIPGISQNTGSLKFKSQGTDINDGFLGTNSTNTLYMADGSFNNGDIKQVEGELKAEIISVTNLRDFIGQRSDNVVNLLNSNIRNVTQSGGTLDFMTNRLVNGDISGTADSINKITVSGANIDGNITQNTGKMDLTIANSTAGQTATNKLEATNAEFSLHATSSTMRNIILSNSTSSGASNSLTLEGNFTQTGGTSNFTFSGSTFKGKTTFDNTQSASLIFTKSTIHDVAANRGSAAINLSDGSMQSFNGTMGDYSVTLAHSNATTFEQMGGNLTLNASNTSEVQSVMGKNFSNISITLDRSKITRDVTNKGETTITMQDAEIGGNVTQETTSLSFTASNSKLTGQYKQTDGTSMVNFINSKILGGIDVLTLNNGTMNFTQRSEIQQGVKAVSSRFTLILLSNSSLVGGFTQENGEVTGTIDESTLNGNMTLSGGNTNFSFYNKSTLNGNIGATNHNTTILIDDSTINGNMTIDGGVFSLTAQHGSTVQGNAAGNKSQANVTDADFTLILDTGSTFNGNITQTNNKQTIIVKQSSTLNGNIINTNVASSISVNNATINGDITQNQGSLALDISNGGKVKGSIALNNSNTTLSGSGIGNQIGRDFTQTGGTLTGAMNGLTLQGTFKQTNGTSSVTFTDSVFQNDTTIKDATNSSLTFIHSTLTGYTTDGGANNTLKLLNNTTMTGTLTLTNGAQTTLTMDGSQLNGANGTATTGNGNSTLTFDTNNSTIIGKIDFNTGGLKGTTDDTKINGNIELKDTASDVLFGNASTIDGDLTVTGANSNNTIKFYGSSITGDVSQTGGTINFDLSNGSSIGRDLTFKNATAHFTGGGPGNTITGNFLSDTTTLTGDVSSLNLKGTFTQNNGSSSIVFKNDSLFEGKMTLTGGTSDISFLNGSGIRNEIKINNQTGASISLNDQSFIQGNIAVSGTNPAALNAQNNSTITGDINLTNSTTNMSLRNQSSYQGNLIQDGDSLAINADNSTLTSNIILRNGSTNISLSNSSNLTGTIEANNNPLTVSLTSNSSFNSVVTPLNVTVANTDFSLNASGNSVFGGNLTQTSNNEGNHSANLTLGSGSTYSGMMIFDNITLQANFNQSQILSNNITIAGGNALINFNGMGAGGEIQSLTANGTDLTINTKNQSHININDLKITGNNLNLTASNSSRLSAKITLNNITNATYNATTNGNLNVDTKIADQASTLIVNINGGILQGSISQDPNGNNGFATGEVMLQNAGRWAVTEDTQIKELILTNTSNALFSDAIFASVFNSPLSYIDFTLERGDIDTSSRIGKEIVAKPQPVNGQIPDPGNGQTYARTLQLNELKGDNGLFRVYADLGTKLADNILAEKASGNHLIQVQYRAATFREIGSDRIVVAKVTDANSSVSFKGTQSEIGLTKYNTEIIKENAADGGYEWIIGQATPAGMSYSSKIIASILQSQYRTFMVEIDSLDRRMGDLEFIKRDKGFWIRSYIGSNTKEATDYSTLATDDYYSVWSGFDYNSLGLTVHNFAGVFFNYTGINTESKDYIGKSSNISFGFYNTFKANSGFYADILAKYIYTISEFEISNYSLAKNSPKFNNHKFLLNAEIGYSFYYGEKRKSGYIQPQLQVTSGYIHKTDLSVVDVSGETINATIGRNFPVSVRTGAFWGQVFGEKIKSHIKLGTSFVYDVDSGGDLFFKDSSTELSFKQGSDFRWVLSAAADFTFSEFFKLYTSFDTSFFGNYNTTYSANLGIRLTFGRSNNRVANVPMVYNPYTPPVNIEDDRRSVPVVQHNTTKDIDQNYAGKPRKIESYIQGNTNPHIQQGNPAYVPTRQPHRDLTDVAEFGEQ